MDMIYHAGTGTMIPSAECLRVPMDVLAEYDDDDLDDLMTMQHIVDESGTPLDAPIWLVVAGNPIDGLKIYGPFWTAWDATAWAERCLGDETYIQLTPLDTDES